MKRKKLDLTTLFPILLLLAGLSLFLYPSFADWWNSFQQNQAISGYEEVVEQMNEEDYEKMFADARAYNEQLRTIKYPFMYYRDVPGYDDLLNVMGNGIIGYIKIPKIGVELAVYHGTSEGVLQVAVGHLEGSSLPVGGENTHTVLSAHRGLPSAKLFTDLDEMEVGDRFSISVANEELVYEVDQILIVLPSDVEPLYVQEGKDLCTLITCTPYGVNSHRLLVRGHRVEGVVFEGEQRIVADAVQVEPMITACFLIAILFVMGTVVYVTITAVKKRNKT